ncbi:MAG: hypothetical protein LBC29_02435, partial [Propionibacteriaceae bacterium]|nr:hypothetical protein [Propionibacteriaceae bacterium]
PTIGTNSPTQTQPTETTKTEPAPAVNGLSLDQFRKLVTEAIPGVAEVEPMTVDTLVTSADFYDCTSMESLLSNLQAVASGSWKDLYVDFYLFDSPDSAKAMGVALKTCWHSGSLTVDESVKEYYGVTNYFYESANSTTDQVDNLAVYGNVAVWPDTFKAPFDEAQKAWEEQFIPSVFASGIAQVT